MNVKYDQSQRVALITIAQGSAARITLDDLCQMLGEGVFLGSSQDKTLLADFLMARIVAPVPQAARQPAATGVDVDSLVAELRRALQPIAGSGDILGAVRRTENPVVDVGGDGLDPFPPVG